MDNKAANPNQALESRGAKVAEVHYTNCQLDGPGIIENAEFLFAHWTRGDDARMLAIAEGFRQRAYLIAQTRAGQGAVMAVPSEFWVETGESEVCVLVDDYEYKVIAWTDAAQLTSSQLLEALEEEYPGIAFDTRVDVTPGKIHAIGRREL